MIQLTGIGYRIDISIPITDERNALEVVHPTYARRLCITAPDGTKTDLNPINITVDTVSS